MATCADPEGWAPISHKRPFDSTPCFEEGIVLVAVLAVLFTTSVLCSGSLGLRDALDRSPKSYTFLWLKIVGLLTNFFS